MKKKVIWGIVIVVLIGGSISAWYIWSMATEKTKSASDLPTAFKVSAEELMDEFIKDSETAIEKYSVTEKNEEAIEITGTIVDLKSEKSDELSILFKTNAEADIPDLPAPNVIVTMEPNMLEKMKSLKIGDRAKVRGIYSGYDVDVKLNRGEVIE